MPYLYVNYLGDIPERISSMNFKEYHKAYFTDPIPKSHFRFCGSFGVTLFFEDFASAVKYYQQILGSPAYVEGKGTRGWPIGSV